MASVTHRIEQARHAVDVAWSDDRARRIEAGLIRKRKRRAKVRVGAALAAAAVLVGAIGLLRTAQPVLAARGSGVRIADQVQLSDGSRMLPAGSARLEVAKDSPSMVVVQVADGRAMFDIVPRADRVFRVEAGNVSVEVLGTAFSVDRSDEKVSVSVQRGRVRVGWNGVGQELAAGQSGTFPPDAVEPSALPAAAASASATASATAGVSARPVPSATHPTAGAADWQALAREGDFDQAYRKLDAAGWDTVGDSPADLLLAADVARLSRHSANAVAPLRRLLAQHPSDPRAPLASFTLGRVLLDELGRPREAADAFSRARSLAPGGVMAEDALAREVEALSRAGDINAARARAELYLRQYPNGRRQRSVKRFGGLE